MGLREFIITKDRQYADVLLMAYLPLRSYEGHLENILKYMEIRNRYRQNP